MVNLDRLAEQYYADRDPQYDDGKVICDYCGNTCDIDSATIIESNGLFADRYACPSCMAASWYGFKQDLKRLLQEESRLGVRAIREHDTEHLIEKLLNEIEEEN